MAAITSDSLEPMADPRSDVWAAADARLRSAEKAYFAAAHARDELVATWRADGATWGELAKVTGLGRPQILRMARRAGYENGSQDRAGGEPEQVPGAAGPVPGRGI